MKRIVACLIAAVSLALTGAARADQFHSGSFMLSPSAKTLVLMDPPPDAPLLIALQCDDITIDSEYPRYRVTVDGAQVISTFNEESGAFVKGREISVHLQQDRPNKPCTWTALGDTTESFSSEWRYDPSRDHTMMLAAFDTPTRFQIAFNASNVSCDPGTVTLYRDGKELRDPGGDPMPLLAGSSFIGTARIVHLTIAGGCQGDGRYTGTISVPATAAN
ncbi:hypothetical protein [Stappia sp. ES.058]|uniref:hypothetical protein n=1 Tax=Stappia sp. ES.058 TaxID=1881061 RepID=UPI00087ABB90|nr:hypothetical protein [Stappia sp. ES.058]SDU31119.1 hypothetical protein SAMN05428979_2899 [Stappia sp. ES.058]